jgi:hypothetical protein
MGLHSVSAPSLPGWLPSWLSGGVGVVDGALGFTCCWTVPCEHVVHHENPPVANADNKLVQISTQPSSRNIPVGI